MLSQGILGTPYEAPIGATGRVTLRTGRVTTPVSPITRPDDFNSYVQRCLRMWTVDVLLDSGEYVSGCRIVAAQGNDREGVKRMFRFPTVTTAGTVLFGDLVVVGFLNGQANNPVVFGALIPQTSTSVDDDTAEAQRYLSTDPLEWQDRHDNLNLADPSNPLRSSTLTRDSGLTREFEHQSEVPGDGTPKTAHILERDHSARSTQYEQVVDLGSGSAAVVRKGNTEGRDFQQLHAVQTSGTTSSVSVEDLQAQVLQLTHQVAGLTRLLLRSDPANTLSLQHDSPTHRLTAVSDVASKTVSVMHEDLESSAQGGVTFGPDSEIILRRASHGEPEAYVRLGADGSVTMRSANGPAVRLDADEVLLTSKTATVLVSESQGVSVTTKGGMVSVQDDALVLMGQAVQVQAAAVHLASGVVRVGSGNSTGSGVPSAETLYKKLQLVEEALVTLFAWARSHVHTVTGASGPTSPPVTELTAHMPAGQFSPATVKTDSLQTFRGE